MYELHAARGCQRRRYSVRGRVVELVWSLIPILEVIQKIVKNNNNVLKQKYFGWRTDEIAAVVSRITIVSRIPINSEIFPRLY